MMIRNGTHLQLEFHFLLHYPVETGVVALAEFIALKYGSGLLATKGQAPEVVANLQGVLFWVENSCFLRARDINIEVDVSWEKKIPLLWVGDMRI